MNRKRIFAAAAYITVIIIYSVFVFFLIDPYMDLESAYSAYLEGHNLPEPSIVRTEESSALVRVYAAGRGYVSAQYFEKGAAFYTIGWGLLPGELLTKDNTVAYFFDDLGIVLGAWDVPGATQVRFELWAPGDGYRDITVPLNLDGCFIYEHGTDYVGVDPFVTRAEALDADGNVLDIATEADWDYDEYLRSEYNRAH